ncbi:MAG: DNA-binding response regulator [Anaerolineaceae bacterium]|nr:DNA-binding response regulator [Anaerolineaceae bacterium]
MKQIKILLADDHFIVRQGLRLILDTEPGFVVVGEAENGEEAIQLLETSFPDVILMDLRMPVLDGISAIHKIMRKPNPPAIVILTTFNEDELMMQGLRAGAKGFLLKDTDRKTLFDTIHAAARGDTLLQPDVMARLINRVDSGPNGITQREGPPLSERELEVLQAVAKGERSKEIAFHLGITERTVKAHLSNIYAKFGVDSRAAAIAIASQRGLLKDIS